MSIYGCFTGGSKRKEQKRIKKKTPYINAAPEFGSDSRKRRGLRLLITHSSKTIRFKNNSFDEFVRFVSKMFENFLKFLKFQKFQKSQNSPKFPKIPKIPKFQKFQKKSKTNCFRAVCMFSHVFCLFSNYSI